MLLSRCRLLSKSRHIFPYHSHHHKFCNSANTAAMLRSIDLKKDYYKILGVSRNSKPKEIRKKYFEAAKKYHPDVVGNLEQPDQKSAHTKYLLISQAYEILSNKQKRKLYDEEREKRNYNDPNTIKKDFYANILRKAKHKGINLNQFKTEYDAYKWYEDEQKADRQYALKEWRRKVKQRPMSKFNDYYYLELMNENIMNAKQRLALKNACIAIISGIGIFALWRYITSDTQLTFSEFYLQSPLLQQLVNKFYYKKDLFTTVDKNKALIDSDGNWKYNALNKTYNDKYEHNIKPSVSVPPSFVRKSN
eukprot:159656_1